MQCIEEERMPVNMKTYSASLIIRIMRIKITDPIANWVLEKLSGLWLK